jgi:hypothetical protein
MAKTVSMTAPNGAAVTVSEDRVESLTRFGFTKASAPKAPAKKAASSKSKK